jgi:two-component system response regulator
MDETAEILLVEDNPDDAELALHVLKKNKIATRIQLACDGAEALDYIFRRGPYAERAAGNHPRVILLDLKLSKVDGLEVLRQIKENSETSSIPVVTLTSSREDRDISESYKLGANSYIVKPVDFEQFSEVMRQIGLYWLTLNRAAL